MADQQKRARRMREIERSQLGGGSGFDLSRHYPELGPALLVCATETKTPAHIARYTQALRAALS